jgi:hypothetical protein
MSYSTFYWYSSCLFANGNKNQVKIELISPLYFQKSILSACAVGMIIAKSVFKIINIIN